MCSIVRVHFIPGSRFQSTRAPSTSSGKVSKHVKHVGGTNSSSSSLYSLETTRMVDQAMTTRRQSRTVSPHVARQSEAILLGPTNSGQPERLTAWGTPTVFHGLDGGAVSWRESESDGSPRPQPHGVLAAPTCLPQQRAATCDRRTTQMRWYLMWSAPEGPDIKAKQCNGPHPTREWTLSGAIWMLLVW